jgi:NADPH:quinone reductase-like Zn-dependent oxidoreductase
MKAVVQQRYGGADALELADLPCPSPGPGEVRVRVVAAGMDRGAWHFMTGRPYLMRLMGFGLRAPSVRVPGTNLAGVVDALGPGVSDVRVGDEVYGSTRGTFAEYAVASTTRIAAKPPQLTFEQAAVLPYPTFVSLQALHDHGRVQAGQSVLVVGASGAVGTITVQLAVAAGARVTGVCSSRGAELVRSLGAEDVVDYRSEDFLDGSRRYDLVIDIGGRTPVSRLRRALTRNGTLVIIGGEGDRWIGGIQRQAWATILSRFVPQRLIAFVVKETARELEQMNAHIAVGTVVPALVQSFPLAEGPNAVALFERGALDGRIAVRPEHVLAPA